MKESDEIRFKNIVGMGVDFSSMIRLFEKCSDDKLCDKIVKDTWDKIKNVKSKEEFDHVHQDFCDWGTRNIILAEKKKRDGSVIKRRKPASYGQIAKTLNVTLKVMVYYCHLPDPEISKRLEKWLHAAVDKRMMDMLRAEYQEEKQCLPESVEKVDKEKYRAIQEIVLRFINKKHNGRLTPVKFDDVYWYKLNP